MRNKTAWELAPWYRQNLRITGAEADGDEDKGGDGADGDEGDDGDDADDDSDDGDKDRAGDPPDDDTAALRKALRDERAARKVLEKEKAARDKLTARQKKGEADELSTLKVDHEEATGKVSRLAEGFLTIRLENAITTTARELKFLDPTDATALIKRADITFDQDDDDPSSVDIDETSVKTALQALAKKKPHLIGTGTNDGAPTGTTGTGRRNARKGELTEKDYREMGYSAL